MTSTPRCLAALVISFGACPTRTNELTERAPLGVRLGREHGQVFFRHRELVFFRKWFDGERCANYRGSQARRRTVERSRNRIAPRTAVHTELLFSIVSEKSVGTRIFFRWRICGISSTVSAVSMR